MKYEVGFSWDSKAGKKTLMGQDERRPSGWLAINVDGQWSEHVHEDDLPDLIKFDAEMVELSNRLAAETARKVQAKAEHDDIDGFDAGMTPMQAGRAIKVLNALVNYNGRVVSRKTLIREKIADGWIVDVNDNTLNGPDDRYIGANGLTLTGVKYAMFLINHKNRRQ